MPGYTKLLAVSADADTEVIAQTATPEIHVCEDASAAGAPKNDYVVKKPDASATGIRRLLGTTYVFRRHGMYSPGERAGCLRLPEGAMPTVFSQDEI